MVVADHSIGILNGAPLQTIFCDELSVQCFCLRSLKIDVSTFEDRCVNLRISMCRPSKMSVSTFEDRCVNFRYFGHGISETLRERNTESSARCAAKSDVSTFGDRCVHLRRSVCRLSKIDVSTFGDRCVDLRISMIDVSTFEDRWSMCRPSKIDDKCVDLRRSMIDVKFMLLHLLKTLIATIVVCEVRRGFALKCFHSYLYQ